jgi:prolyl oligopeptidase
MMGEARLMSDHSTAGSAGASRSAKDGVGRLQVFAGVLLAVTLGLNGPARAQTDERLRAVAEEYWQAYLQRNPEFATRIGDDRFNASLPDLSLHARRQWEERLRQFQAALRRTDRRRLSTGDRLDLELLERRLASEQLKVAAEDPFALLEPFSGPHLELSLLSVYQPFRDLGDYQAYIARLRAFPEQTQQAINTMRSGMIIDHTAPRVIVEKVIPQLKAQLVTDVTRSELYRAPAMKAEFLSEAQRTEVMAELAEVIRGDIIPAYWRLLAFVEDEYLPYCRETIGLGALPNGDRRYRALASHHTTLRLDPLEIHEIGLKEVERIRKEMEGVQTRIGFAGSLTQFLDHMRNDPKHRATSAEQLLQQYRAVLERTKPLMSRLFETLPKADCVVKEREWFCATSAPMAYYDAPPQDGSRPGYFYINTCAPKKRTLFLAEALTYYEALPGHHIQLARVRENNDLPAFRRYAPITAYEEGWALYAAGLGKEIGGYRDPVQEFGRLNFEMWQACRLVVDTGIHLKGWTRGQALGYLMDHTAFTPYEMEIEVDRCICGPARALGCKMGELTFREMRRKAEQTLGDEFDLRVFHDALLSAGPMPLDVFEHRMDQWMVRQKQE